MRETVLSPQLARVTVMFPSRNKLKRFRQASVWGMAVAYLLVVAGVPIPIGNVTSTKDLSRPFPCMHSQCGCGNAEQCWRSCCCHTVAERIAWAEARRLPVPEALTAAAATAEPSPVAERSCCETDAAACPGDEHPESVVLIEALACQGLDFISGQATIAIKVSPVAGTTQLFTTSWLRPRWHLSGDQFRMSPATPPPRLPLAS